MLSTVKPRSPLNYKKSLKAYEQNFTHHYVPKALPPVLYLLWMEVCGSSGEPFEWFWSFRSAGGRSPSVSGGSAAITLSGSGACHPPHRPPCPCVTLEVSLATPAPLPAGLPPPRLCWRVSSPVHCREPAPASASSPAPCSPAPAGPPHRPPLAPDCDVSGKLTPCGPRSWGGGRSFSPASGSCGSQPRLCEHPVSVLPGSPTLLLTLHPPHELLRWGLTGGSSQGLGGQLLPLHPRGLRTVIQGAGQHAAHSCSPRTSSKVLSATR